MQIFVIFLLERMQIFVILFRLFPRGVFKFIAKVKRRLLRRIVKPVFHLANLFARREAKTRIRQRDWLTLVGEKIRREQVGTVPTFFCSREQIRQVENGL